MEEVCTRPRLQLKLLGAHCLLCRKTGLLRLGFVQIWRSMVQVHGAGEVPHTWNPRAREQKRQKRLWGLLVSHPDEMAGSKVSDRPSLKKLRRKAIEKDT